MPICVCTICGCICATKAEWSSGNKGLAAHRVGSTVPTHGLAQPWSGCCCAAQGWGAGYSVQSGGGIPTRLASVAWGRPELMALWQSQKSMGMRFWRMNSDLWGLALGTFGWFSSVCLSLCSCRASLNCSLQPFETCAQMRVWDLEARLAPQEVPRKRWYWGCTSLVVSHQNIMGMSAVWRSWAEGKQEDLAEVLNRMCCKTRDY